MRNIAYPDPGIILEEKGKVSFDLSLILTIVYHKVYKCNPQRD